MAIATYVINLEGSTERFKAISSRLEAFSIPFERIPAVDGRKLDLAKCDVYDPVRAVRYMGRRLVGGEIGCFRSHLDAATRFLASDASYGLILEDDALPVANPMILLGKALPELESIDPDWLLLNIGNDKLKITSSLSRYEVEGREFSLVAAHYFPMTTSAIVWSRKGAQRFVEEHNVIFAPVDNYFRYWLTREGHGYSFWPAPVTTTGASSLIDLASKNQRRSKDREWYYGFAKKKRLVTEKLIAISRKWRFRGRRAGVVPAGPVPGRYS